MVIPNVTREQILHHRDRSGEWLGVCRTWEMYRRAGLGFVNRRWFHRKVEKGFRIIRTKEQHLDFDVAKTLAVFASIAYCHDQKAMTEWTCTRCGSIQGFVPVKIIFDPDWDVSGYVGYYPKWKSKFVVFRGTNGSDLKNWIENLKATQHQVRLNITFPGFEDIRVHNGFSRIWNIPFKETVMSAVREMNEIYGKEAPLYVAGHSAGGATAQLAAFAFKTLMNCTDIRLYTFGSPRVGNWPFAAMLSDMMTESWRFTHNRDPVPILPWMFMGFWHSAQEVFQKEHERISLGHTITEYEMGDGTGEDPRGHDSMCRFGFGCSSIYDHYFYLNTILQNDGTC